MADSFEGKFVFMIGGQGSASARIWLLLNVRSTASTSVRSISWKGNNTRFDMIDAQGMVGHTPETWNACFDAKNPDGLQWADRGSVGIFVADCHDKGGPNVAAAYGEANALPIPACVNALGASALS